MVDSSRDDILINVRDVCWMWSMGATLVVDWSRPFLTVEDVPSSTYGHIATDGPFYFRTLVCCQIFTNCIDSGMADSLGSSLSIRYGVCGGLMSLELTVTDGITMVGLDDRILL